MPEMTIEATDGGSFSAYVALPSTTPGPAVLVIQEIFGVNAVMRATCDWLAREGYVAVCPDLFWRIEPGIDITDKTEAEWKRAFELFGKFDVEKGVEDLKATLAAMRKHEAVKGKVGAIGYCLGGKMAYLAATRTDVDCSVGYYGVGIGDMLGEARNVRKPLMLHVAALDQFCPPEEQRKVQLGLSQDPQIDVLLYANVNHAFAREGGQHHDGEVAALANGRTLAFFRKNLA